MRQLGAFCLCLIAFGAQAQASASLRIESVPARAFVTVDSVRAGRTPVVISVTPGAHQLRVTYSGYAPAELSVDAREGETTPVIAELVRFTGVLVIAGLPSGTTASVEGAPVTGPTAVPSGLVRVRVETPGGHTVEQQVRVAADSETTVEYLPREFDEATLATAVGAPSVAQFRGGRPFVGVAILAGIAGGFGAAVVARGRERDAAERLADARLVYQQADSEADAVAARAVVDRTFTDVRSARRAQTIAYGTAALVYAAGLADAVVRHAFRPAIRSVSPRLPDVSAHGAGIRLAFAL